MITVTKQTLFVIKNGETILSIYHNKEDALKNITKNFELWEYFIDKNQLLKPIRKIK